MAAEDAAAPSGAPLSREVPAPPGDDPAAVVDALEDRVLARGDVQPHEQDGGEVDGPVEGVIAHDEQVGTAPPS